MRITVEQKDLYGNRVFYPVCDSAKLFASIAGTKTLTREALKLIQALGVSIETNTTLETFTK